MALPELQNLSANARALAAEIDRGAIVTDIDIVATALGRVFPQVQAILLKNLKSAISSTREFNTPELSQHLQFVFSNPDIIRASPDGRFDLFTSASLVAGDWVDLDDGIRAAREILGISKGTVETRSLLWKQVIYRPAREGGAAPPNVREGSRQSFREKAKEKYERTIETRLDLWGDLAPYWLFLNYGSSEAPIGDGGTPYPNNAPTHFIENTEDEARPLLQTAIEQVNREIENIIFVELEAFDRRRVKPLGQIIKEFFVAGQPYKLYITPKRGILGVRRG